MRFKYIFMVFTCVSMLGISAGKEGGSSGGAGLNPNGTPGIGELVYYDSDGYLSTVEGSVVDPDTGGIEGNSLGALETTVNDTNGMGTWTNNTSDSTVKDCSTSDSTVADNMLRIIDLHAGGTSGTPGFEIPEQCIGKTEALDPFTLKFVAAAVAPGGGNRCLSVGGDSGTSNQQITTTAGNGHIACYSDLGYDTTTNTYRKLYVHEMNCVITATTGLESGECFPLDLMALDITGGVTGFTDAVLLNRVVIGGSAGITDCNGGTAGVVAADVDCSTRPCTVREEVKTLYDIPNTTGSGSGVDVLIVGVQSGDTTVFSAGAGVALTGVDGYCTIKGAN